MVWGVIAAAASSVIAGEVYRKSAQDAFDRLSHAYALGDSPILFHDPSPVRMLAPFSCSSCGSKESRQRQGIRVCSYCRSEG